MDVRSQKLGMANPNQSLGAASLAMRNQLNDYQYS